MDHPTVRIAKPSDRDQLLAMCKRLHGEIGLFNLDVEMVETLIDNGINRRAPLIIGVIGDGQEPEKLQASACLFLTEGNYYSKDLHLIEFWNYVDEPFRKSGNAAALLEFCKDTALKISADQGTQVPLIIGLVTSKQTISKVRLYRRHLGIPAGAYFVFNSKWDAREEDKAPVDHRNLLIRLKEYEAKCRKQSKTIRYETARQEIAPLLSDAIDALGGEEVAWGSGKMNGTGRDHV